jgi:hypothetical protein
MERNARSAWRSIPGVFCYLERNGTTEEKALRERTAKSIAMMWREGLSVRLSLPKILPRERVRKRGGTCGIVLSVYLIVLLIYHYLMVPSS